MPETTRSRLIFPCVIGKGNGKMIVDLVTEEFDEDEVLKSAVQTQIDHQMEEIDTFSKH